MTDIRETIFAVLQKSPGIADMNNANDVRALDISNVVVDAAGGVRLPANFFANAKRAKPHLFKFDARTAPRAEYEASKKSFLAESRHR